MALAGAVHISIFVWRTSGGTSTCVLQGRPARGCPSRDRRVHRDPIRVHLVRRGCPIQVRRGCCPIQVRRGCPILGRPLGSCHGNRPRPSCYPNPGPKSHLDTTAGTGLPERERLQRHPDRLVLDLRPVRLLLRQSVRGFSHHAAYPTQAERNKKRYKHGGFTGAQTRGSSSGIPAFNRLAEIVPLGQSVASALRVASARRVATARVASARRVATARVAS